MQLNTLDYSVVAICLLVAFAPAVFFARRAGRATSEFFASGRSAPWWLIGTSMVATTFSTDTPNLVTDLVRSGGVANNWAWWAFLLTGMATVFFYARLWRRSGVLTDLEFYELRYSGKSAAFVRGFRAIYLGLFLNCVIMGTVSLAAVKIANVMLGWETWKTLAVCSVICISFSALSGLWGVLASDIIQFIIAMVGVFGAAYYALDRPEVGGLSGMLEKIDPQTLRLVPDLTDWELTIPLLIIPLAVQWWAVWYPGSEPGGGGYVAQRMLAAKDERHSMAATLWFSVAHYALRPWPWVVVALCSMLVFPELTDTKRALPNVDKDLLDHDIAYPAMLTLLPHGLLGLLIASLLSAYVSTMSTHLNWGASYLVHDFYRRFVTNDASERHYIWVSRGVTFALMLVVVWLVPFLDSAKKAFDLLLGIGAGTGSVYLLRWFWWRVNAWSEIAAMIASAGTALTLFTLREFYPKTFAEHWCLVGNVAVTTITWLIVTYLTSPTERPALVRFYRIVRPAGPGWASIRAEADLPPSPDSLPHALLGWLLGCTLVYAALFGAGGFLYGNTQAGVICTVLVVISGVLLWRMLAAMWRQAEFPVPENPDA